MFQIKVCGVTSPADALAAVEAGADALGLNFYAPSPRFLAPQAAQAVAIAMESAIKVGVFVNAAPEEVRATFDQLRLDFVQLHGDEPPEYLAALEGRPVIKAFRLGPNLDLRGIADYLEQCARLGVLPRAILIDAHQPGQFGGTGQTCDWQQLAGWQEALGETPLVLAGGLRPDNVASAIAAVGPSAVDTASGVEQSPGRKDPRLLRAFVSAARAALIARST
jgi:phosphoribosylanthranilate isomerase